MREFYELAVRLSFSAPGLAIGVGLAQRAFVGLERAATSAERAVLRTAAALNRAQGASSLAFGSLAAAQGRLATANASLAGAQQALATYKPLPGTSGPPAAMQAALTAAQAQQTQAATQAARAQTRFNQVAARQATAQTAHQQALAGQTAAQASLAAGLRGRGFIMGGAAVTALGMAGLSILRPGIAGAAALQQQQVILGQATPGSSTAALENMIPLYARLAGQTQFGIGDIARFATLGATGGLNKLGVLREALPGLSRLAEVAMRVKGISPDEAVQAGVGIAHFFQAYPTGTKMVRDLYTGKRVRDTKRFNELIDLAGRATMVSNLSPGELMRLMSYMAPAQAALGLRPQEIVALTSLAANTGLTGGRGGGSRLMAMFRGIAPFLSSRGSYHNWALKQLTERGGGQFFDPGGTFLGVQNMLQIVARATAHMSQRQRLTVLNTAFGAAGGTAISALTTPGAMNRNQQILKLLGGGPGSLNTLWTMQIALNKTVPGQWSNFTKNVQSLSIVLATALLPALNGILQVLVAISNAFLDFATHHKTLTKIAATVLLVGTAVGLIVGPIMILVGAFALLGAASAASLIAMAPFLAWAALAIIAVSGVILVLTHLSDIGKFLKGVWDGLTHAFREFAIQAGLIHDTRAARTVVHTVAPSAGQPAASTVTLPAQVRLPKPKVKKGKGQTLDFTYDPTHPYPGAAPIGVGGGGYGPVIPPIIINIHGPDHRTSEELAQRVAHHVGRAVQHSVRHAPLGPHDLSPTLHGV